MRITLRNYFSCADQLHVDTTWPEPRCIQADSVDGHHCQLGEHCLGLFAAHHCLFVYLDGRIYDAVANDISAIHHDCGDFCIIELQIAGEEISIRYPHPRPPISTPFYSEDEEDADFGLWLANILQSDERREILFKLSRQ